MLQFPPPSHTNTHTHSLSFFFALLQQISGNCLSPFDVMLEQVKGYENIIPTLVEALKYISSLSFDMLIYSCIEQMANQSRDRVKKDGTNVAQWYVRHTQYPNTQNVIACQIPKIPPLLSLGRRHEKESQDRLFILRSKIVL